MEPIASSYDRVAGEYAAEFQNEMERKPFDRKILDWQVEKTQGSAPICDLGCGPRTSGALFAQPGCACVRHRSFSRDGQACAAT
jgi:hypothetical protein